MTKRVAMLVLAGAFATTRAQAQPGAPGGPPHDPAPTPSSSEPLSPAPPAPPAPPASAPSAPPASTGAADGDVLAALVALFDPSAKPEQRVAAFASPALRDRRAIPPIVFLLSDRSSAVRAAAARALGAFPGDPRAEGALESRLRDRAEADAVRLACLDALVELGADAGDLIYDRYADTTESTAIHAAAQHALEASFPNVMRARGAIATQARVDRSGRELLTTGGLVLGGYALASVGALGRNDAGATIGAIGGAITGAGAAYLFTRDGEITNAQAGWIVSGGVWGAGLGMLAAGSSEASPSTRYVLSLGLAGEAAGVAATALTARHLGYSADDIAFIDLAGVTGLDLAYGAYLLQDTRRSQRISASLLAGGLAGLTVGGAAARHVHLSSTGDRALAAEGAYEGMVYGLLVPEALEATGDRGTAGGYLGAGLGLIAGTAMAQAVDADAEDVGVVWLIGGYGKLLGVSLPMLADGRDPQLAKGAIAGGTIGLAGSAMLARRMHFHNGDAALVALGTGIGAWHGAAFATSSASLSSRQESALPLLGLSVGGLASIGLSQEVDLSNTDVLALLGSAFWGNWFTLWTSVLAEGPNDQLDLRPAAIVGDAGVAVSAALLAHVDPRRIGIAYLGGLSGAGLASLGAALATKDNHTVILANLIGSGLGLAGGALLAASIHFAPSTPSSGSSKLSIGKPMLGPLVVASPTGPAVGLSVTVVN